MGVLLLLIGLAALGFGFFQHLKGKRILAAPFKKTGDITKNPVSPDPKGLMSTEGKVVPPAQQLLSPCSKTPCLYYEVDIKRNYEKTEQTQDGTKTTKSSDNVESLKEGAVFGLDDGSGPVTVDAVKGGDFDNIKKSNEWNVKIGSFVPGELEFGQLRFRTPKLPSGEYTTGFTATERIVPLDGSLFALGKLEGGKLTKPGWRSMMFSSKGRDGLLASTAKKKKGGFIGGGVAAVLSVPLMIFGPSGGSSTHCSSTIAGGQTQCDDNVTSKSGNDYAWTVEKAGNYELVVTPPAGKKFPLDAQLVVKNAAGEVVKDEVGEAPGKAVSIKLDAQPGTYTVTVKDVDGTTVKGGFDYKLAINAPAGVGKAAGGAAVAAAGGAAADGDLKMSADDLYADWSANEDKYTGKSIFVQGEMSMAGYDKDENGKGTLSLKTKDLGKLVILSFSDAANNAKAEEAGKKMGGQFAAKCTGERFLIGAMMKDCTVEALDPNIVPAGEKLASGDASHNLDADAFASLYKTNRKGTDTAFQGQVIVLTGKVNNVDKNMEDKQYVSFASKLPFAVQALFPAQTEKDAMKLKHGQKVSLKCRVRALSAFDSEEDNIILEGCSVQGPAGKNVAAASPAPAKAPAKKKGAQPRNSSHK